MKTFKQHLNEAKIKIEAKKSGNVDDFFKDLDASTQSHPFDDRQRLHGMVGIHASPFEGGVHLHDIVNYGEAKQGNGTSALEHLKSLADTHGVEISGTAKAYSNHPKHITKTKQLVGWYKKHGFKIGHGSAEDGYEVSYKGTKK
jgi:hypothetical protein